MYTLLSINHTKAFEGDLLGLEALAVDEEGGIYETEC